MKIDRPEGRPAIPDPRKIEVRPFKWRVLTPDSLPKDKRWVYYGITPKQYEILSRNMADILRWIREARWRLRYYRGKGQVDGTGPDRTTGGAK